MKSVGFIVLIFNLVLNGISLSLTCIPSFFNNFFVFEIWNSDYFYYFIDYRIEYLIDDLLYASGYDVLFFIT